MPPSPLAVASVISRDTAHSSPHTRIGAEANKDPNIHEQSCQFPCSAPQIPGSKYSDKTGSQICIVTFHLQSIDVREEF